MRFVVCAVALICYFSTRVSLKHRKAAWASTVANLMSTRPLSINIINNFWWLKFLSFPGNFSFFIYNFFFLKLACLVAQVKLFHLPAPWKNPVELCINIVYNSIQYNIISQVTEKCLVASPPGLKPVIAQYLEMDCDLNSSVFHLQPHVNHYCFCNLCVTS